VSDQVFFHFLAPYSQLIEIPADKKIQLEKELCKPKTSFWGYNRAFIGAVFMDCFYKILLEHLPKGYASTNAQWLERPSICIVIGYAESVTFVGYFIMGFQLADKKKERFAKTVNLQNRKASFEYQFLDTFTAGIALTGTEIKSIRESKANLSDAFCLMMGSELFVRQLHIAPYEQGTYNNHNPLRDRKLLLTKKELRKLGERLKDQGLTIVPTRLFINDRGLAKLEIALAKGKKHYDKRESIKERDVKREMDREY
jgi:SsrA-binding protein